MKHRSTQLPGSVRIIGGRWRGTRFAVGAAAELRPSSDRVRETLFNWLAASLPGARCLDLFAGTGVLGFEAVSRGAGATDLVEADSAAAARLVAQRERLGASEIVVHCADAFAWLRGAPQVYDIVFVDPPFHAGFVPRVLAALAAGWLGPEAMVYVEMERGGDLASNGWQVHRHGATRQVDYALVRYTG